MCQTAHHPLQAIGPSAAGPSATFIWSCGYGPWAAAKCPSQKEGQESNTPASHTYFPVGQITASTCGTNGENQDRIWAGPMVMDGLLWRDT